MTDGFRVHPADGDPEDLGEPIAELNGYEEDVSRGFIGRVLGTLHRRSLIGQVATMAWTASAQAILEFLGMIFSLFTRGDFGPKDPEKEY